MHKSMLRKHLGILPEDGNDDGGGGGSTDDGKPAGGDGQDVNALPEWARAALTKANKEAADYRTKYAAAKPLAEKAQQLEDAQKSELQKAQDALAETESRAQAAELKALRLEVAQAEGLTPAQAARLVGGSLEELTADAKQLVADFGGGNAGGGDAKRKPGERLKFGSSADPEDGLVELNPQKLAAKVPRGFTTGL